MKSIHFHKIITVGFIALFFSMCVPPEDGQVDEDAVYDAYLDSLREVRCPRLLSSAAEYYKNRDWQSTINAYRELVDLGCDRDDPEEVYQYYAISYEFLGLYDSSEFVLVKGLQQLPNNVQLRKRLVYAYSKQSKTDLQIDKEQRCMNQSWTERRSISAILAKDMDNIVGTLSSYSTDSSAEIESSVIEEIEINE